MDLSYGVKFEVRKHFTREGAYFTVVLGAGYWVLGAGCWVFKVLPRASPMGIPMGPSGKVTGSWIISTKILLTRRDPFGRACPKE